MQMNAPQTHFDAPASEEASASQHTCTAKPLSSLARAAAVAIVTLSLVFCGSFPQIALPQNAFAVTEETEAEPDELQQRVEQTAADYDAAVERVGELEEQIADNRQKIDEIEKELPEQEERAADAMREQYKLQREAPGLVELVLGSGTLADFLTTFDYISHVQNSNFDELDRLTQMKADLETTQSELDAAMDEAEQQQVAAEQALADAQAAREEAQRKAEEEAARAAEEQARLAAEQEAAKADEANGEADAPSEGSGSLEPPSSDGADWSSDKETFVAQWAPRIDAYLAGSPMAGQGTTFAAAAWDYGVDPRWSPAIANTESSKGLYCFLPYNAWGWGSYSWGSWEEAINDHVRGLARGYGYTISVEAAQKYCPPNWEHWYNATLAQMNMI